jgi:hypothetical protein
MSEHPAPPPGQPGQPAAPAPTGIIRLTIQGSMWTSNAITPTVRINGYPVPSRYGTQDLVVWAGPNHLDMETQWMRTYGQAALDTAVAPGQVVEVWYASPWHQFRRGDIGFTKQTRGGIGCLILFLAMIALVFVLSIVGGIFGS